MSIKETLQDYALQEIEKQIILVYNSPIDIDHSYMDEASLLRVRKNIINRYMLQRQEELLPDIIAFNEALREALRKVYDRAHDDYENNKERGKDESVDACCFLDGDYPALHPLQTENRQELWEALLDSGWNRQYDGVTHHPLVVNQKSKETFDEFIGMKSPSANWNEGLDPELTKDLRLINAFYHLFNNTEFAITDFIYCRDFWYYGPDCCLLL
jgi:hypothetical protein